MLKIILMMDKNPNRNAVMECVPVQKEMMHLTKEHDQCLYSNKGLYFTPNGVISGHKT